jgi:hypothetical protein
MIDFIGAFKEYQLGTMPGWALVAISLAFWWKGLPSLIESWEKRSDGIEGRLQTAMKATLDRYELELQHLNARLTESDHRHKECEERAQSQSERINHLEKEIIGFQRQIAAQDIAAAGRLSLEAHPATKAMVQKMQAKQ